MLWALARPQHGVARWHVVDRAPWLATVLLKRCKSGPMRAERSPVQVTAGLREPPDGPLCAVCVERSGRTA